MTLSLAMRVLVVEDHAETRDLVGRAIGRDGHVVAGAATAAEAQQHLAGGGWDVGAWLRDVSGEAAAAVCGRLFKDVSVWVERAGPGSLGGGTRPLARPSPPARPIAGTPLPPPRYSVP